MQGLESRTISTLTAEFIEELLDWTLRWSCFFGARSCWGGMQWHVATCNNMQWQIFSNGLNIVHATRIQNLLNFQWIEFICKSLKSLQRCDSRLVSEAGFFAIAADFSPTAIRMVRAWSRTFNLSRACLRGVVGKKSVRCFLGEFLRSGLCCSRLLRGITLFEGWTNGICNVGCQEICCDCSMIAAHFPYTCSESLKVESQW